MIIYIVLLRGINVSGKNKLPMADLRELLSKQGFINVSTYIQSGNIVLQSSDLKPDIETKISTSIEKQFGFKVPVLVKTQAEFQAIFDDCKFSEEEKKESYFTILHSPPEDELITETSKITYPNETFFITKPCVYFYTSKGYGKAKGNNNFFERKLKVSATTRNYKTMLKLLSLCQETN